MTLANVMPWWWKRSVHLNCFEQDGSYSFLILIIRGSRCMPCPLLLLFSLYFIFFPYAFHVSFCVSVLRFSILFLFLIVSLLSPPFFSISLFRLSWESPQNCIAPLAAEIHCSNPSLRLFVVFPHPLPAFSFVTACPSFFLSSYFFSVGVGSSRAVGSLCVLGSAVHSPSGNLHLQSRMRSRCSWFSSRADSVPPKLPVRAGMAVWTSHRNIYIVIITLRYIYIITNINYHVRSIDNTCHPYPHHYPPAFSYRSCREVF